MNNPRYLAAAGATAFAAVYFLPFNVFNTPASNRVGQTIGKGAGSEKHQPLKETAREVKQVAPPLEGEPEQGKLRGVDSQHFEENIANQTPGEPGVMQKKWNQAHYGTDKGRPT